MIRQRRELRTVTRFGLYAGADVGHIFDLDKLVPGRRHILRPLLLLS